MKEVTITINDKGWEMRGKVNGVEFVEIGVMQSDGTCTHAGTFEKAPISQDLRDALASFPYDVANTLTQE